MKDSNPSNDRPGDTLVSASEANSAGLHEQESAPPAPPADEQSYTAGDIQVLKGLEAVRRRPSMYIGSTSSRGLHHLVFEVVDNSIDEALAGVCDRIVVVMHTDGSVSVEDNGRGIPTDIHPEQKRPALEVVMTILHAGGKFDRKSYKVSGGLHGVGVSVVNALSEWLEVRVFQKGAVFFQRYERGEVMGDVDIVGSTNRRGTLVRFKPDPQIFEETEFKYDTIAYRLRELAFLNAGLSIVLRAEAADSTAEAPRYAKEEEFLFLGGVVAFVGYLNEGKTPLHPEAVHLTRDREDFALDLALQYTDSYAESIFTYVNNINTLEGGTHLVGFKSALTRCLNAFGTKNGIIKDARMTLSGEDVREGLSAVLSIKVRDPQFEGQTKTKLGNSEVKGLVESIVGEGLTDYLENHEAEARLILDKCLSAARAREASR